MINPIAIASHLKANYRFMHVGLLQVVIKPFLKTGVNAPIYLALRDKRLRHYKSSLLAVIQTNVCKGPIFFNCYPNFMVDLTYLMTTEALKLDVHVQGDEFLDFKFFFVVYRIYFRLMSSNLNIRFLDPLPSNSQETILLQIEDDKPTAFTPKALKWDEITISDVIELQEPQPSAQIERCYTDQIIEEPDGRDILKFRSLSQREDPSNPDPSNYRRSFSEVSSQTGNLDHPQRYRFRSLIPEPIVDPPSPTSSSIGNTINVLTKLDFSIDWPTLKDDYYSPKNSGLRKWFKVIDYDLREQVKTAWITDMERLHVSIPFFLWFPTFTSKYGLPEVYSHPSLNVQTTLLRVWHFVKGGSVSAIHPPLIISPFYSKMSPFWQHLCEKAGREILLLYVLISKRYISNLIIQILPFLL